MESTNTPSLAKRSKAGKVTKKCMPKSSLQLVDEVVDEGVPEKEPAHDDEEANLQRALELNSETELEEEIHVIKAGDQDEGQAGPNPGEQDEGQAGSNPEISASLISSFMEKPQEEEPGKTNAEAEVQSMVSVPIHQDTSSVPLMTTPVIDLTKSQSDSPLLTSTTTTSIITTTTITLPPPLLQSTTDPILVRHIVELDYLNQHLADQEEACKKKRKRHESPRTPPRSPPTQPPPSPPPPSVSGAPADIPRAQELSPTDYLMQDDSIPEEQVLLSDDEDSKNDHQPKADLRKDWWKPLPEEERPTIPKPAWTIPSSNKLDVVNNWASALATIYEPPAEISLLAKIRDMTTFMNWYCQKVNKTVLTQADFKGQAYEVVKAFYPDVIHLYKGSNPALSISKMKVASYLNFRLKLLVPEQMWIDDVCTYDTSAKYGIFHWWFNRQKFYIDRHDSSSHRKDVRTYMRILSVVRIKAYSRYGYDYLSGIVLRRADFQEHTIAKKDFKNLYPSDFEDLNLLLLQGHLDHLPGSDKRMLSTAVKLWTQNLVIRQRVKDFQPGIES
ncbi:hypothetical protein Tco_0206352 [Tanacetum coccineum]